MNAETQEIEAEVLTDNATNDAAAVDSLLDQTENRVNKLGGDGAHDKWNGYHTGHAKKEYRSIMNVPCETTLAENRKIRYDTVA